MSATCTHRSVCPCWEARPGMILACNCDGDPAAHAEPTGCRYVDADRWEAWRDWPGVSGKVLVCHVHGGRAPGEAYDDISTTQACLDSTTADARVPRKPRRERSAARARLDLAALVAESQGLSMVTVPVKDLRSVLGHS